MINFNGSNYVIQLDGTFVKQSNVNSLEISVLPASVRSKYVVFWNNAAINVTSFLIYSNSTLLFTSPTVMKSAGLIKDGASMLYNMSFDGKYILISGVDFDNNSRQRAILFAGS